VLRIGSTAPEDDPTVKRGEKIKAGSAIESFYRAMYLSNRDCVQAFQKAVEVDAQFLIAYAISNNTRRVFDLTETERRLGFRPRDDAEFFYKVH
jgi:hypothetical protein